MTRFAIKRLRSTESEVFYPLIYLDAAKFLVLSVCAVIEMTCPKIKAKTLPNFAKSLLPVDVRGLKRLCSKVPYNDDSDKDDDYDDNNGDDDDDDDDSMMMMMMMMVIIPLTSSGLCSLIPNWHRVWRRYLIILATRLA